MPLGGISPSTPPPPTPAWSEPKTPSFCWISGDLAPSTRKSLAIAIVRLWRAKVSWMIGLVSAPSGQQEQPHIAESFDHHCLTYAARMGWDHALYVYENFKSCGRFGSLQVGDYIEIVLNSEKPPSIEYRVNGNLRYLATGEVRVYRGTGVSRGVRRTIWDRSLKIWELQIPCFEEFFWGGNTLGLVPARLPHALGYACTFYAPTSPEPKV